MGFGMTFHFQNVVLFRNVFSFSKCERFRAWSVKFLYTSLYNWSDLMICFDSELFPQNFVWQLNNDRKSLKPHRNCQIKSSKWLYFSFHMSQRIDNIQFYSYESIFLTNFKRSKHFALKKSSELWHSSSSRKGRPRIAAFQYYSSKDHGLAYIKKVTGDNVTSTLLTFAHSLWA